MGAISGMGLSLDGRYHDENTPVALERSERVLVAGPCPRINRELPWIQALEFCPLNPVSVGLRILGCHFPFCNSSAANPESPVNCVTT